MAFVKKIPKNLSGNPPRCYPISGGKTSLPARPDVMFQVGTGRLLFKLCYFRLYKQRLNIVLI